MRRAGTGEIFFGDAGCPSSVKLIKTRKCTFAFNYVLICDAQECNIGQEDRQMKKVLMISLVALGLVFAAVPVQAGDKHQGHNYHAGKSHHGFKAHHRAHKAHYRWHRYGHKHRGHAHRYGKRHHRHGRHHFRHHHKRHKHYKHYKSYKHHTHYKREDIGDEILIGSALIGGAIVAHAVITQPDDAPRARYESSPYAPFCEQTDVYRHLPDGRIQWGVRTRCR